jgi:hypothetical protein
MACRACQACLSWKSTSSRSIAQAATAFVTVGWFPARRREPALSPSPRARAQLVWAQLAAASLGSAHRRPATTSSWSPLSCRRAPRRSQKVSADEHLGVGHRPIPSSSVRFRLPIPTSSLPCVLSVYDQRKSTEAELIYTEITDGWISWNGLSDWCYGHHGRVRLHPDYH